MHNCVSVRHRIACALDRIPAEAARQAWALYDEMLAREDGLPDPGSAPMAD